MPSQQSTQLTKHQHSDLCACLTISPKYQGNTNFNVLCLQYVSKVHFSNEHACQCHHLLDVFERVGHKAIHIAIQPTLTSLLQRNSYSFLHLLSHALSCPATLASVNKVYI